MKAHGMPARSAQQHLRKKCKLNTTSKNSCACVQSFQENQLCCFVGVRAHLISSMHTRAVSGTESRQRLSAQLHRCHLTTHPTHSDYCDLRGLVSGWSAGSRDACNRGSFEPWVQMFSHRLLKAHQTPSFAPVILLCPPQYHFFNSL
jgi:hypothetical protein